MKPIGVIHKVHTLEGGRVGPAKSVLTRMRGGGVSAVTVRTPFFAGSLQDRNKIKKMSYLDSQNYRIPSLPYS